MEETIVRVLDNVPRHPGWAWFPDCNMVGISRQLCPEERDRAIADLQARWRRSMIRVVGSEIIKHGDQAEAAQVR